MLPIAPGGLHIVWKCDCQTNLSALLQNVGLTKTEPAADIILTAVTSTASASNANSFTLALWYKK